MIHLALALAFAPIASAGVPTDFCYEKCSPQQKAIWEQFQQGSPILSRDIPGVFSGACFHTKYYDPTQAHYAVAAFDTFGEKLVYGGEFSFFVEPNPYAGLTLEQVKAKGFMSYDDKHLLLLHSDYAEADLHPNPPPIWHYWFRQSASGQDLFLLALWEHQRVFCRLLRHHPSLKSPLDNISPAPFE